MPRPRVIRRKNTLNVGTRVRDKRPRLAFRIGMVANVAMDPFLGKCCRVRWDDGSSQWCLASDLRKIGGLS